jgi:membrane associated rhomboid family serine protease
MIPLKDLNPRRSFPFVTLLLIVVNALVFFFELSLPPRAGQELMMEFGMIPARLRLALASPRVPLSGAVFPLFTSMFLHGGWLHIIGNMWFLWIFGDNVEDRLGHLRYLGFYLICGVGAGLVHTIFNWNSSLPSVGASGAISGVMGAYIVLFPRSRVLTLIPLIIFWFTVELPAYLLLGYWFLIQFFSGLGSLGLKQAGGVAWWAHIGGFLLGVFLIGVMQPKRRAAGFY